MDVAEFADFYKRICSNETIYSSNKGFYNKISNNVRQILGYKLISDYFAKTNGDMERLRQLHDQWNVVKIINSVLEKINITFKNKNALASKENRIKSLCYEINELHDKLHLLNTAVIQAPEVGMNTLIDDGYTLPLTLISRIDVLIKLNEFSLAYEDMKNIIKIKAPFLNNMKLLKRLLICRNYKTHLTFENFVTAIYPIIGGSSLSVIRTSLISNVIEIRSSQAKGKEATANGVINPGDVLLAETPTALCLSATFFTSHCQTCLKRFKISYSCPDCCLVSFCSNSCKLVAIKDFHKYECKILSLIIDSGVSILSQLALRLITQLGLAESLKVYNLLFQDEKVKIEKKTLQYIKLFELENNKSRRTIADFFERSLMATFLVQCLKRTSFFDKINSNIQDMINAEEKITLLLLEYLQVVQFNAHEIFDDKVYDRLATLDNAPLKYVGIGIYQKASRFNHHCYPTILRYFRKNKIILRSNQLLQYADVVAENYGPVFIKKSRSERQRYLSGRYWFDCTCTACLQNWPLLNEIMINQLKVRCSLRTCKEEVYVMFSNDYNKLYKCQKCSSEYCFSKLHQNIVKKCFLSYSHSITVINQNYLYEAVQILIPALRVFHHLACSPNRFTHLAEISLQYSLMNLHSQTY